jgi:pyruvate kinase
LSALIRSLAPDGHGELVAELGDEHWRVVWRHGDNQLPLVAIDPRATAALLLNRDLREAPGAQRPDTKDATAVRIAEAVDRRTQLPGALGRPGLRDARRSSGPRLVLTLNPLQLADDDLRWALEQGIRMLRINLGRNSLETNLALAARVQRIARDTGVFVGLLFDLPGPKARLGQLEKLDLQVGQPLVIGAGGLPTTTAWLFGQVAVGDVLVLGRRGARARIVGVAADRLALVGIDAGGVRSFDSVFIEGRLAQFEDGLTPDDLRLARGLFTQLQDITVAPSFVESPRTAPRLRRLAHEFGAMPPRIVAKIETRVGIANADAIADTADGLMIGRDDLSREAPVEEINAHVLRWAARFGAHKEVIAASSYFADLAASDRLSPAASAVLHELAASAVRALVSDETAFLPVFRAIVRTGVEHGFC